MAAYCTLSDIEKIVGKAQLGQLTNDTSQSDEADPQVVSAQITRAQNYIDAELSGRYTTPFTTVPGLVADICKDIAAYYCFMRRFSVMEVPKAWQALYDMAIDKLKRINEGDIDLDIDSVSKMASLTTADTNPAIDLYNVDAPESSF